MKGRKLYRAMFCMVLVTAMLMTLCVAAYAEKLITKGFSPDNEELLDEYISVYGWEKDKMLTGEWESNGESYYRQVGGQREYLSDCFSGTNDFLMSEAEYDSEGNLILEGNKTATMDFLDEHEIPLGNDASSPMIFGAGANGIVAVALAEVGRTDSAESPPNSNNVKYNTWYYGHAVSGDSYAWCVVFIMWCAEKAGCADVFPRTAGTEALGSGMKEMGYRYYPIRSTTPFGGSAYTPVPGDIMLFTTGSSISSSKHVGLVVSVEADGIWVVEGNTTGFGQVPGGGVVKVLYDSARLSSYTAARNALIFHVNYPTTITDGTEGSGGDLTTYIKGTLGINEAALSAVIANIAAESGGDAAKTDAETGAYGLFQWSDTRLDAYIAWCQANGRAYDTATAQIQYLAYDLQRSYRSIWNALRSTDNSASGAYQAAMVFAGYFDNIRTNAAQLTVRARSAQRDFWPQYAPSENSD